MVGVEGEFIRIARVGLGRLELCLVVLGMLRGNYIGSPKHSVYDCCPD